MYEQLPEEMQMRLDQMTMQAKVEPIYGQIWAGIEEGTVSPLGLLALCADLYLAGYGDGVMGVLGREAKVVELLEKAKVVELLEKVKGMDEEG